VRDGKIVLIDMPIATEGSVARAISVLQINSCVQAATAYGANNLPSERRSIFLLIDEAHEFLSDQLIQALATARAADMGIVLSMQAASQVETAASRSVRDSILTLCSTLVAYADQHGQSADATSVSFGTTQRAEMEVGYSEGFQRRPEADGRSRGASTANIGTNFRTRNKEVRLIPAERIMRFGLGECALRTTDGKVVFAPRIILTPLTDEVPWLSTVFSTPVPEFEPPMPLLTLDDPSAPDAAAVADALWLLALSSDTTRRAHLWAHALQDASGAPWGTHCGRHGSASYCRFHGWRSTGRSWRSRCARCPNRCSAPSVRRPSHPRWLTSSR
jgi:hypothetical protein